VLIGIQKGQKKFHKYPIFFFFIFAICIYIPFKNIYIFLKYTSIVFIRMDYSLDEDESSQD